VSPFSAYHSHYYVDGTTVTHKSEWTRNAIRISTDQFEEYRMFCEDIEQHAEQYVLFKKKR
jgi:hypothetical protein